jgi:hypothetical protein
VLYRIDRRFMVALAVILPLALALTVTRIGHADTVDPVTGTTAVADLTMQPPQSGDSLTTWVRRNLHPGRSGCVGGTVATTKDNGSPGPSMALRCSPTISLQGLPLSVPSDFHTRPSIELVQFVMARTGASLSVARNAVAKSAGVNSWQLNPYTVGQVGQMILDKATAAAPALDGTASGAAAGPGTQQMNGTRVCSSSGGTTHCANLTGGLERIAWGAAIGAVVGSLVGVGGGLGAVIGGAIAAFLDWLIS